MDTRKWKGILYGVIYGLVGRGIFQIELLNNIHVTGGLMTISFMVLVPFVIGLITAYYHPAIKSGRKIVPITMPLFAIIGLVGITFITGKEGLICAIIGLPIFAFMSLLGALIGVRVFRRTNDRLLISAFLFLPFIIAPIEHLFGLNEKVFTEQTTLVINTTPEKAWQNIVRVKEISPAENHKTLFQLMGFPRPIKAELDTIAVGGVRKAVFDRGLFFTETVTELLPTKVLAFNIKADPRSIPPTALDEHVTIGGKYFDVLEGRYEIENLNGNQINLHLTSKFRLSTPFNFYSGLWSKLIMRDIQSNILSIIKCRCENNCH